MATILDVLLEYDRVYDSETFRIDLLHVSLASHDEDVLAIGGQVDSAKLVRPGERERRPAAVVYDDVPVIEAAVGRPEEDALAAADEFTHWSIQLVSEAKSDLVSTAPQVEFTGPATAAATLAHLYRRCLLVSSMVISLPDDDDDGLRRHNLLVGTPLRDDYLTLLVVPAVDAASQLVVFAVILQRLGFVMLLRTITQRRLRAPD